MADRWGYGVPSSGYSFPNLPATSETWSGLSSSPAGAASNQHSRPAGYGMDRGTSPYACSECGYSFYTLSTEDITKHMLSHIGSRQSPATSAAAIGHSSYASMQGPAVSVSNGVSSMNSLNSYPYSHPNAFPSAYPLGAFPGQQRASSSAFPGQDKLTQSAFPGHDRLSQGAFPGQDLPSQSVFPGYERSSLSAFPGQERSPPSAFPGQERSPPSVFPGQERSPPSVFPGQERSSQSAFPGPEPLSHSTTPSQNKPSQSIFPGQSPPQSVFPGQQPSTVFPGQVPSHYNHPKPPPLKPAPHIQQQLANKQKELDNKSIIESIYSYPIPKSNETIPVKENKLASKPKENNDISKHTENDVIPKPEENDKKTEAIPQKETSESKPEKPISVIKPSLASILGIGPSTLHAKFSEEKLEKNEMKKNEASAIDEKMETSATSENNGDLKQQKRVDIDENSTSNSSEKDGSFTAPTKKLKPDPDLANNKTLVVLPTLGPTLVDEEKVEELTKVAATPLKAMTRELTTEEIIHEKEKVKEKGSNKIKITPFAHMNKYKVKSEKSAVLNFFPNKSKKKAMPKAPPKPKPKPKPKITSPTPVSERGSRRAKSEVNYAELDDPYSTFLKRPSTPKVQPPVANQDKDIEAKTIKSPVAQTIKSPVANTIKSPVARVIKSPVKNKGWTKSKGYADHGRKYKLKDEPSDDSDSENGDDDLDNADVESDEIKKETKDELGETNGETKVENKVKLDAVVSQFSDHPLFSILGGEEEWGEQVGETAEPEQDDHIDLSNFLSTDMPPGVINPNGPRHKAAPVITSNPTEWGYPEKPQKDYAGKRYQCDYCDYGSSELTNIKTHIRGHTGEKPYKCSVCNFRSSRSNSIKMHMRTHTGEKPFKCDLCGKAFTKSSNLIVHRKTHTGEKDYKCALCGDAFITPGELKKHIRCHTGEKPYQCKHCEQCFSDSSTLQRHTKTHTGEKPYECDICGKTFTRGDTLTHHRRTHTGEKPYKCSLCPKAYIQSCRLKQHMMKDHFAHLQQQALNETQDTIARAMGEEGGVLGNAEADLELLAEKETQEIMSAAMKTYDPTCGQKAVYTCTLCPKSYIQSCRLKSHFLKDHLDYLQQQAEDVIEEAIRKGREREEAEGPTEKSNEEGNAENKSEETDDTESHLEQLALQATEHLLANSMQTNFYETDGTESQIKTENNTDDLGAQLPPKIQMETNDNIDDGSQIKTESTEASQESETNNAE